MFDGSTAFKLSIVDALPTQCTIIAYAKGDFADSDTNTGNILIFLGTVYGIPLYISSSGSVSGKNSISCTRNDWNFFCIRHTDYHNNTWQINAQTWSGQWDGESFSDVNYIGSNYSGAGFWKGKMFDVALYNRLLTDEEVTALYQRVIPLQA